LSPRPDLVVISSDIANPKLPEEYEHAKTLLGPAGEQAVSLEFEPRWPEVFKIEPQGSTCTRGSPARDSEAWSPMVCQPPNFLVLILMAMPIRRPTHLITACFNYPLTLSSVTFNAYIPSAGATRLWR
jgi:hypothetical protein